MLPALLFNALLIEHGLSPEETYLLRHQANDVARVTDEATYRSLWEADDPFFEYAQAAHSLRRGAVSLQPGRHVSSFLSTPDGGALFIGIWAVKGNRTVAGSDLDPAYRKSHSNYVLYDLERTTLMSALVGRLEVAWGNGARSWVQYADGDGAAAKIVRRLDLPPADLGPVVVPLLSPGPSSIIEEKRLAAHVRYERQSDIAGRVKARKGYTCEACDFDFRAAYGDLGADYIEAHHKLPFALLSGGARRTTDLDADFAVLCANCHRMIHRMEDPGDVEGLRALVQSLRASCSAVG